MALMKWEPLRELEHMLERYAGPRGWPAGRSSSLLDIGDWSPRVDISEMDDSYLIQADIPGVAKEDLKVTLDQGLLTLAGERREEKEEANKRFHRVERFRGSFTRSFSLPEDADPAGLKAVAREGQLTVTIPRKATAPSSQAVQVPVE